LLFPPLILERISQARCLCEAEKSMVRRVSYVKAVAVCDVPKEVANIASGKPDLFVDNHDWFGMISEGFSIRLQKIYDR
jgi:hypothetical protein